LCREPFIKFFTLVKSLLDRYKRSVFLVEQMLSLFPLARGAFTRIKAGQALFPLRATSSAVTTLTNEVCCSNVVPVTLPSSFIPVFNVAIKTFTILNVTVEIWKLKIKRNLTLRTVSWWKTPKQTRHSCTK
jgi:hypothetical protein